MGEPVQILLITGSIRKPSYTQALAETVEEALKQRDAQTTHWKLRDRPLPIANPDFHDSSHHHPDPEVRELVEFARSSDAFVWSSPVYHNSYSGVLKNALDLLAIPHFHYKPVGLLSHGGNRSTQPVDQLRIVARGLLAVAIPTHISVSKEDFLEEPVGRYQVHAAKIQQRIERFATELIVFADLLRLLRTGTSNG